MLLFNCAACQILHQVFYTTPEQQKGAVPLSASSRSNTVLHVENKLMDQILNSVNHCTLFISKEVIYDS